MRSTETSPPDRDTQVRRMWRMFAIGAVLLLVSMAWAHAVVAFSILPMRMLDGHLSIVLSMAYPLAAAGVGWAILRRPSRRSLLVAVTCCAVVVALITWIGRREQSPFDYQDGRIVYTVYRTNRPRSIFTPQILGSPTAIYELRITIFGPQTTVALLPLAVLPLILRWPVKKTAEPQSPDPAD